MSEDATQLTTQESTIPRWFTIAMIVALVWNLMGVLAFVGQIVMTPEQLAQLPADQQALHAKTPMWANAAFGIAVISGFLGCIAMLMKKQLAVQLFAVSIAGVIAQMFHAFFISNSYEVFGPSGLVMPLTVMAIAVFLLLFAKRSQANGWIR